MTSYIPRQESITGASFSGSSGDANRTYTVANTPLADDSMAVMVNSTLLTPDVDFSTSGNVLTIIIALNDSWTVVLSYNEENSFDYTGTNTEKIRYMLIQENDSSTLTDTMIGLAREDAAVLQSSTDADALNLYTAYLIAERWQSLGFATRANNITLEKPDPKVFLRQYLDRLNILNKNNSTRVRGMAKVSLNKNLTYDATTHYLRFRRSGDDY